MVERYRKKAEPEINITVNKKGEASIRIVPYDHYEECYYIVEGLDLNDVYYNEMPLVRKLLETGEIPQYSGLRKKNLNSTDFSEQIEDYAEATPTLQDKKAQKRIEETAALETLTELLPIQIGTLTAYNSDIKRGVIVSSTNKSYDVYFDENSTIPNVGDSVKYIKVERVAFLTNVGQVKKVIEKTPTEEDETSSIVFVTPHDNSKTDVALKTGQNDFSEGDTVEFVANKADRIIAIQKK